RPCRRRADPARAGEPARERAQVLVLGSAGAAARQPRARGDRDPRDQPRPGHPGGRPRPDLRALPARAGRAGARRRPRARDRQGLHGGERRPDLGGVEARAGRVVPGRPAGGRGARAAPRVSGERILVVDDEPQFLRALKTTLRGAGYEVETATTAAEALTSI